jgi:Protein of unknown function, DUF488
MTAWAAVPGWIGPGFRSDTAPGQVTPRPAALRPFCNSFRERVPTGDLTAIYAGGATQARVSLAVHDRALTYQSRVRQPAFGKGIERLLAGRTQRVVLMCRERDPLDCHRLHLICRYLAPCDPDIRHILPDGALEAQAATERRLLARGGPEDLPLFQDLAQTAERWALERAYDSWWQASAP